VISLSQISKSLKKIDIKKGDLVMMHGDANISSQLDKGTIYHKLKKTFLEIIKYLGPRGTLIIPTFTTSFTKKKFFNVKNSKSEIGLFSDYFRKIKGVKRNLHPIFSVAVIGKYSKIFLNSNLNDCFGEKSTFDLLHKLNGKIVCFGCGFNEITFTIYVEQCARVDYRYFKFFSGSINFKRKKRKITTRYFVRDLSKKTDLDLFLLRDVMKKRKKLKMASLGRIAIHKINSKDYFREASKLLKKNKYGLIEERFSR